MLGGGLCAASAATVEYFSGIGVAVAKAASERSLSTVGVVNASGFIDVGVNYLLKV